MVHLCQVNVWEASRMSFIQWRSLKPWSSAGMTRLESAIAASNSNFATSDSDYTLSGFLEVLDRGSKVADGQ